MKREGNVWIRVFPDKPITKKPLEVRMGKGKGNPEYWAAVVEPGRILFEADGVPLAVAKEALELAAQKLPVKTKFIVRRGCSFRGGSGEKIIRKVKGYTMSKKIEFVNSLKDLNGMDLKARIQEDELRLKKLEFAHAISPLENPMSIRALRRGCCADEDEAESSYKSIKS